MEFMRNGERLKTLFTWHTMDEKPQESGDYLVIWHTRSDEYIVKELMYSQRYGLWGAWDGQENAEEAIESSKRCFNMGKDCVAWYESDFTECYKNEGGEF